MKIAEKLAEYIVNTDYKSIPLEAVTLSKRAMIDTIGVAIAGSHDTAGERITAFAEKFGCRPVAGIIGHRIRTSSTLAALANGTIAHILDYDDYQLDFQGPPSAVLLPAIFAIGEEIKASGENVIEAYVIGVEVWAKISSVMPEMHLRGWHPTGVLGTIGAAAAIAKLLRLDSAKTSMALGIACSQAAGLLKNFGTLSKPFHAGNAAQNGIIAALLAEEGFTASKDVFEGSANFQVTFLGREYSGITGITENIGKPLAIIFPGIDIKNYPSCASTHRAIDAMLNIVTAHEVRSEDVESIHCYSSPVVNKILSFTNPTNTLEAKFSMQFALAMAVIEKRFGLAQITEEKINNLEVRNLMKRITLSIHTNWQEGKDNKDNRPDVVKINLNDGRKYSSEVLVPKGTAVMPLTEEELFAKYHECSSLVFDKDTSDRCREMIWKMEKLEQLSNLMKILSAK